MTRQFDAIIVGAGQAGPSLAGRLTASGMTVALIERHLVGGTCVNTGCMPTKTLVASAKVAAMARRATEYGVTLPGNVSVDMRRVRARAETVSRVFWRRPLPSAPSTSATGRSARPSSACSMVCAASPASPRTI